jgi:hypothetical protein
MNVRPFAQALAVNRILFGVNFLVAPDNAARTWIGRREARRASTKVFARALGARDLGLGLGALNAMRARDDSTARTWMAAHAVADGSDLLATLAARDGLPSGPARFALGMAGASTAIAAWAALSLGR